MSAVLRSNVLVGLFFGMVFQISGQNSENEFLSITVVEEKSLQRSDTTVIQIKPATGNWYKVEATVRSHRFRKRIHKHRIEKFKKLFSQIPEIPCENDFCPMTTIIVEIQHKQLMKKSPTEFAKPHKLKRTLKVWK